MNIKVTAFTGSKKFFYNTPCYNMDLDMTVMLWFPIYHTSMKSEEYSFGVVCVSVHTQKQAYNTSGHIFCHPFLGSLHNISLLESLNIPKFWRPLLVILGRTSIWRVFMVIDGYLS